MVTLFIYLYILWYVYYHCCCHDHYCYWVFSFLFLFVFLEWLQTFVWRWIALLWRRIQNPLFLITFSFFLVFVFIFSWILSFFSRLIYFLYYFSFLVFKFLYDFPSILYFCQETMITLWCVGWLNHVRIIFLMHYFVVDLYLYVDILFYS